MANEIRYLVDEVMGCSFSSHFANAKEVNLVAKIYLSGIFQELKNDILSLNENIRGGDSRKDQ